MQAFVSARHEGDKVIVFERATTIFIFNFHPTNSYQDYRIAVEMPGKYPLLVTVWCRCSVTAVNNKGFHINSALPIGKSIKANPVYIRFVFLGG